MPKPEDAYTVLTSSSSSPTPSPSSANPIGHWRFDETSGTTASDPSGNAASLTLVNAAFGAGKTGNALSLNGTNGYASRSPLPTHLQPNVLTLSTWFNPSSTFQSSGQYNYLIDTNADAMGYAIQTGDNGLYVTLGGIAQDQYTAFSFVPNAWYHLAVTHDGTSMITYVNGVERNRTTFSGSVQYAGGNLNVGQSNGGRSYTVLVSPVRNLPDGRGAESRENRNISGKCQENLERDVRSAPRTWAVANITF
jgi:hypothetical protein